MPAARTISWPLATPMRTPADAQHPGEGGHERVVDTRVDEGHDRETGHQAEKQARGPHHRPGEDLTGGGRPQLVTAPRMPRSMSRPTIPPTR